MEFCEFCDLKLPKDVEMPTEQFSGCFGASTICKIYACASSFETFEINNGEHSFMAKALLQALDCPLKKKLHNLFEQINKYYSKYNVSGAEGNQLIRPRMEYGLLEDLSLDDPIKPYSKTRDLLLTLPMKFCLCFNHHIMKYTYKSICLCFEAVYSNVLVFHVYCDAAKQPTLKDVKLSHNSGLLLTELKSKGIASYEINNLLVLKDVYKRGECYPRLQFTFQMSQDATVIDKLEYEIPSNLINIQFYSK